MSEILHCVTAGELLAFILGGVIVIIGFIAVVFAK